MCKVTKVNPQFLRGKPRIHLVGCKIFLIYKTCIRKALLNYTENAIWLTNNMDSIVSIHLMRRRKTTTIQYTLCCTYTTHRVPGGSGKHYINISNPQSSTPEELTEALL